jgi:hypothetical protein
MAWSRDTLASGWQHGLTVMVGQRKRVEQRFARYVQGAKRAVRGFCDPRGLDMD